MPTQPACLLGSAFPSASLGGRQFKLPSHVFPLSLYEVLREDKAKTWKGNLSCLCPGYSASPWLPQMPCGHLGKLIPGGGWSGRAFKHTSSLSLPQLACLRCWLGNISLLSFPLPSCWSVSLSGS